MLRTAWCTCLPGPGSAPRRVGGGEREVGGTPPSLLCGCGVDVARHTAAVAACISPAWIK